MNTSKIKDLAYQINQAKKERLPKPIVFLGAGASRTGDIPLAGEIVEDILERHSDNPQIELVKEEDKTYAKLMDCLTPFERNKLLKEYIDRAKINVTHIYLAQLLSKGYVDYVLTVNFDNLMLRALALYNEFPPTYDMAILKDLTTTNFKEKSVLYLHGQHHGLWLLNTQEEMDKVKDFIPPILNKITNQRPWIFIGYSGDDPIFDHIINLGRFDNGLYWVCYYDSIPGENVCGKLLDKPNTNASIIQGYDADSFMIKLNQELKLPQPLIIDKPFTSLKNSLENIVDIDDQEHFRGVKERLEIVKNQVGNAIEQFEEGHIKPKKDVKDEVEINQLKKEIIDRMVSEDYDINEIEAFEEKANKLKNNRINEQLANLYIGWGNSIIDMARLQNDESLFRKSSEKYEKVTLLKPKDPRGYLGWGNGISELAKLTNDESLFKNSFEKYEKAVSLNPKYADGFNNWGTGILDLAKLNSDKTLYEQSIEKLNKSVELGGRSYNLACAYALIQDKKNALKYLESSLKNNEQNVRFVENDEDWKELFDDEDFKKLLDKYRK